jgi:fructosamine-3-kinase
VSAAAARALAALGWHPQQLHPLHGGCVSAVFRAEFADRPALVVKHAADGGLAVEGFMLDYLSRETHLPVPRLHHAGDRLLVMDHVESDGLGGAAAEREAAEQIAQLHDISAPAFGFERDTVIGGLPQPNTRCEDWPAFFRDRRLLFMGRLAHQAGRLPADSLASLEALCVRLEDFLGHAPRPGLVHGDVWSGNVLYHRGQVAAYIDPAIYFADPEVELAFIELFSCFGPTFFARYAELRPIDPGYRDCRRDIYNLYPLLVHTALFGGPYPGQVDTILRRYA